MEEKRNVLIESARFLLSNVLIYRIARSNVLDLDSIDISKYDVRNVYEVKCRLWCYLEALVLLRISPILDRKDLKWRLLRM